MAAWVRGRLITSTFADTLPAAVRGAAPAPPHVTRAIDRWSCRCEASVGPASSVRTLADVVVIPLLRILGFDIDARAEEDERCVIAATAGSQALPVVVVGWDQPLQSAWRATVLKAVTADARWCFCSNGRALRIVDAQHTWSRHYLELDLALLAEEPRMRDLLWSLARAEAFTTSPPLLDVAIGLSARQGISVCRALGDGVLEALERLLHALARRGAPPPPDAFEQALTVLYRVLFLLFAEARGLVPLWHPIYRERYTIASIVETLLSGRQYRGVWQAVLAISRLAHAGCSIGELKVTAFNGRLFAPSTATAFERARIDDGVMAEAVLAVSTTDLGRGRARIAYRDLDVEQLGAVYEHVLDYEPREHAPAVLTRSRDARKSTGTFYTPRAVTDYLVRHTLAPLVGGRSGADILSLRVLDPAMGSGAFLVATCRYLAAAAEEARIREGLWHPGDVTAADRATLRRDVALRCLFGVDLNPMAVQLGRLSIWLATLAADRPLTFLDHHLVSGNSLVGASPDDVRRQPSRVRGGRRRPSELPLFGDGELTSVLQDAVRARLTLADEPDASAAVVHRKERTLAAIHAPDGPLGSWRRVLDLWCAGWFRGTGPPLDAGTFSDLYSYLLGQPTLLAGRVLSPLATDADAIATRHRFLHWPLAFPEVFADERGEPRADAGFDAVIGNPPWDMVRGDSGGTDLRTARRDDARMLTDFVREAGIYRVESGAHVNRYQLFLERALQLARPGGRIGLVLPSGAVADAGSAALRRHLFARADVDLVTGLDNRHGIFPIHRGVRFVLLAATAGAPTTQIRCRFGVSHVEELDAEQQAARAPLVLTRRLLSRLSGEDDLGIPELATAHDLTIVEQITATTPWLGSADGWNVRFGRELNATDDRGAFVPRTRAASGRPVLEGKQIDPFRVAVERSRFELLFGSPASARVPRRPRLAYRDVASATNRLTLIAAIIPGRCVTTHTLFCLKTPLPLDAQHVLCALLNSFVANYLIRLRVNTHVTASLMSRLPVPHLTEQHASFQRLATLSRALSAATAPVDRCAEYPEVQALVAHLYRLKPQELDHVLGTFPLIGGDVKEAVLLRFKDCY